MRPGLRERLAPIIHFSTNWISRAGVFLVTAAAILWIFLLPLLLRGRTQNPYAGILLFVGLPAAFLLGLALIPVGTYIERRRAGLTRSVPVLDLHSPQLRSLLIFILIATAINVVIGAQLTYSTVNYMESVSFCGTTCHVMTPQFRSFQVSPHANAECLGCHAGPGASGFVKSKLAGVRQLVEVMTHTFPTPIPPPSDRRLPAQVTCERCHSPEMFHGELLKTVSKFASDATNSRTETVLLLHVGGAGRGGIHGAHLGHGVSIRYAISAADGEKIPWVELRDTNGTTTVYKTQGTTAEAPAGARLQGMDCADCHNLTAHPFQLPERAVDEALTKGSISPSVPWIKKRSVDILKATYRSEDDAAARILAALESVYHDKPAVSPSQLGASASALVAIYRRNIFPDMKVTWGTYPNNLGHTDALGCFRCHDDLHVAANGNKISQDCSTCHNLVTMDEAKPKILNELGVVQQ